MARLDHPDLWAARIQEQIEGLARADKMILDAGDPVVWETKTDGLDNAELKSGESLAVQITYTIDLEK